MSTAVKLIRVMAGSLVAVGAASPTSPYAAEALLEDCRARAVTPESVEAIRCAFYVQGFLDAARAAEPSQAATTVRLPFGSRVARIPAGQRGRYCIGADTTVEEIIRLLLRDSGHTGLQPESPADELLESVLRQHHACSRVAVSEMKVIAAAKPVEPLRPSGALVVTRKRNVGSRGRMCFPASTGEVDRRSDSPERTRAIVPAR
jgi:hypothetical protein